MIVAVLPFGARRPGQRPFRGRCLIIIAYEEIKHNPMIGAGSDAVDIALINLCQKGDIVVTQDYGVAALAL